MEIKLCVDGYAFQQSAFGYLLDDKTVPNSTKSTLQTVDNLGLKFRDLINTYKALKTTQGQSNQQDQMKLAIDSIASQIRTIISPLIIRRSRIDLDGIPASRKT